MSNNTKQQLESIYLELNRLAETSADADKLNQLRDQLAEVLQGFPTEALDLSFSDQLRVGIAKFETEHPTLAKAAEEVVDNLARLGI